MALVACLVAPALRTVAETPGPVRGEPHGLDGMISTSFRYYLA